MVSSVFCLNRNIVEFHVIKSKLRKSGVTLVSVMEPDTSTPTGRLVECLIQMMNDSYRAQHSEDTRRGIEAARRRCQGVDQVRDGGRPLDWFRPPSVNQGATILRKVGLCTMNLF